jgi:hypothetical protein
VTHISSQQAGITHQELQEAIPENLQSKNVHLYWIDKAPAGDGQYTFTAKIEINEQVLLLSTKTSSEAWIKEWDMNDPTYHTNARLIALERILTDPDNENKLLSL